MFILSNFTQYVNEEKCRITSITYTATAKVVRTAIQNAALVAGLMLTTEAIIAEKPKKEDKAAQGPNRQRQFDMRAATN